MGLAAARGVRKANRRTRRYPSEEWARIRVYGEAFNVALRRHVVKRLKDAGHAAIAPMLVPNWTIVKSERFSYASSWSERHAAHAAGLGTFGLCDGLITAKGKAMRAGSVVAKISINRRRAPMLITGPIACFLLKGLAANALTVVRSEPLPRPVTIRKSAGSTWLAPESM